MRLYTFALALASLAGATGCQHAAVRKPPTLPEAAVHSDATGEQKVMMEMMRQMAQEDAGSIRK